MAEEPNPAQAERDREAEVAAAVADLEAISQAPIEDHHDRLARAHQALHQALQDDPTPPLPGVENGQTRH